MINITIIGMGLIGTSLGMALRSAPEDSAPLGPTVITGYDRDAKAVADARGRLAIDRQARTLEEAVREAELVVVAVPAMAVRAVFAEISPLLAHGAVVTDVTSTKAQVVAWASELLPRTAEFVGGHPMAGKEQTGPASAERDLFKDALYCLTPLANTRPDAIAVVEAMARQAGARPYFVEPVEHDSLVGGASHLPFLLSTTLVGVTSTSPAWREIAALAASGYRDISRLAAGDVAMHRDICLTNPEALTYWIDRSTEWLAALREQIAAGDADALTVTFEQASRTRDEWQQARPNQRPGEDDFIHPGGSVPERRSLFGLGGRKGGQK